MEFSSSIFINKPNLENQAAIMIDERNFGLICISGESRKMKWWW